MNTYIQKDIEGYYFESEDNIAHGYTYEDFMNGLPIKLSDDQVRYKNDNPDVTIKDLINVSEYVDGVVTWHIYTDPNYVAPEPEDNEEVASKIALLEQQLAQLKAEYNIL